jgi:protein-disulfide isomerase
MLSETFAKIPDALLTVRGAAAAVAATVALGAVLTFAGPSSSGAGGAESGPASFKLAQAAAPADGAGSGAFTPAQKEAIEQIVRDYLIRHPEIMMDVSRELEKRQAVAQAAEHQKVILEKKAQIFLAPTDFVLGNPKGDITIVEFFDYNCGWCKKAVDELSKLTKADTNIRVVLKEFPIFGENSALAAKAAMASIKQNKYWEFHVALMKERQVTKDNLFRIAEKTGLDVAKLKAEMENPVYEAAVKENTAIAQALGIEGTPGFIVDARVNVGFLPADGLRDMVAEVRKAGCQVC